MADATGFGRFVWCDLLTPDTAEAQRFYTSVIGWGTRADRPLLGEDGRPPYTMLTANHAPVAGLVPLEDTYWLGYVSVSDVVHSVGRAKNFASRLLFGPHEIPMVGRFAVLEHPNGGTFGLFESRSGPPPSSGPPNALEFCWHELTTRDPHAALDMLNAMFGWEAIDKTDMRPLASGIVFGREGVPFGRIFQPAAVSPSSWCHYVLVNDVRATLDSALQSGGQPLDGLQTRAEGSFARCRDPLGAVFGLHSR